MVARNNMVAIDILNTKGLYTKTNPDLLSPDQLRVCDNVDYFRTYGAMSKIRGTSRVLSTPYTESSAVKAIPWVGFYKYTDLAGQILRHTLIGAGTTIRRVESDGSTTELATGEPVDLFRTDADFDQFKFITSQDGLVVGNRGTPRKYDGEKISRWGILAPGTEETVIENFTDASTFTTSGATASTESTITWFGNAVKVAKSSGGTSAHIQKAVTSFSVIDTATKGDIVADRVQVRIFIPKSAYRLLDNTNTNPAVSVWIGSDGTLTTDYYRYDFRIGRLVEGWNTLSLDFSTIPGGEFGTQVGTPNDGALNILRFEINTNNTTDTPIVYWDHFVKLDRGTMTDFSTAAGSIAEGARKYRFSYVSESGRESNAGIASVEIDTTGLGTQDITLNDVPVSSDPQVVRRNIYRTVAGGTEYLFLDTINDNVSTSYTDDIVDTGLSSNTAPLPGDFFDNSPPPFAAFCRAWKRTMFMAGDPLNPNILYFSLDDQPEAFPILNAFQLDSKITGIYESRLGLIVTTETDYWRVLGDNPDYLIDKVIKGFGAVGPRAVGAARQLGWAADRDGLRLYDLQDTSKISEVIRDQYDQINKVNIEDMHTDHSRKHNSILQFNKDSNGEYTNIFQYQYPQDDLRQGWYSKVNTNSSANLNIQSTAEIEDSNGDFHLYASGADGMLYELFADGADDWTDANGSSHAITMTVQTPWIRPGPAGLEIEGTSGRVDVQQVELRVREADNQASTWTVTVESADGSADDQIVRHSQDITFAFPAGVTLLRLSTRNFIAGEYVRFKVVNSDTGVNVELYGLRAYVHVRPGQFIVTGQTGKSGGQN